MKARTLLSHTPAAFALLLWFGATLYFFGDTGRLGDDYTVAMRDPATGSLNIANHPWTRWPYFWRPLHLAHASAINTLSWDRPWVGHLELALIHALVAFTLHRFLVRLGIRPSIARTVAVLFMVCPLVAGAVLWTSTSCNAISSLFLLCTLELVRRQAAGPHSSLRTLWIAILSFIIACWYEPGAAALAAVPFVYFAGAGTAGVSPLRASGRWRGMLSCTVAAGLGCILYVGLLIGTAPPRARGGAQSFVTLTGALPRSRSFFSQIANAIVGGRARDLFAGSTQQGWQALHSPTGWVLAALAIILAPLAVLAITTKPASPGKDSPPTHSARGCIALAGAAMFVGAWIPILVVPSQVVALRSLYVPMLGVAILAAAMANGLANILTAAPPLAHRLGRSLAATTAVAAALACTLGMIGLQNQLRLNTLRDQSIVEQLRGLVPLPSPGTVFLPLRIDATSAITGRFCQDYAIHSAFEAPWSCEAIVRIYCHRDDITATPTPRSLKSPSPQGIRRVQNPTLIEWARCVPFMVGPNGTVTLVRRLTIVPGQGAPFVVEFPRIPADAPADDSATIRLREVDHGTDRAHCVADIPGA